MRTNYSCVRVYTQKSVQRYNKYLECTRILCKKSNLFVVFCVKGLSFAQLCDSTFGGFLISIRACRRYNNFCYKYLECTRILCKKSNLFVVFCVKGLSFAQLCDSTFGGFLISIRACRRYNNFCYKYLECTRILCKKSNLFGKYTKKSCIIHKK